MASGPITGAAAGRSYQLPHGPRVRLRMVQPRDSACVRTFFEQQGLAVDELELARLLRFDPRCRAVICATVLVGIREEIVAIGAIDLDVETPDMVLVDRDQDPTLRELLTEALSNRARIRAA